MNRLVIALGLCAALFSVVGYAQDSEDKASEVVATDTTDDSDDVVVE